MIYNILPGGNTTLHALFKKGDTLKRLLEICHTVDFDEMKAKYEVPFMNNLEGDSPIHLCLKHFEYRTINMFLEFLSEYGIDHHSRALDGTL